MTLKQQQINKSTQNACYIITTQAQFPCTDLTPYSTKDKQFMCQKFSFVNRH